jgi:predicted metal-dependent hydrolase
MIEVSVDSAHPRKHEKAAAVIKAKMIRLLMPDLAKRIKRINDSHFQAALGRISVRDNTSRWGSCSRSGSISLNLRLLFMPEGILDYVIVHELAHTKYRSHGPRFWALVESVMPDHKDRRRWLKENGWSYPKDDAGQGADLAKEMAIAKKEGQLSIPDFIYEEQY